MKKQFTLFISVLAFLFAISGNAWAKSKKTVRIGNVNGSGSFNYSGNISIAKELGYLEEEFEKIGYAVEYYAFENGVYANEAFVAGDIDFAFIGDVPGITGLVNGIGTTWIGIDEVVTPIGIAVKKGSPIRKPQDFIGKTVSVAIGTNNYLLYANYFRDAGIAENQFETANLNSANGRAAVISGKVDAAIGNIIDLVPLEQSGQIDIIFTTAERPEWHSQLLLVGRTKFLKSNPKTGVALFKALIRARQTAIKNPKKFYGAISANQLKDYPDQAEKYLNPDKEFKNYIAKITQNNITRAQNLQEFFVSIGRFQKKIDVSSFIDTSYYEKASKELGITE